MTQIIAALGGIGPSAKLVAQVALAIRRLQDAGAKRMEDVLAGLAAQLDQVADIMVMLGAPEKLKHMSQEKQEAIAVVVTKVQAEAEELQKLVSKAESTVRHGGKLLWKAKCTIGVYSAQFKHRLDRVESVKALLATHAAEVSAVEITDCRGPLQETARLQLRELLQPCGSSFIPKKLDGTLDWLPSHPKVLSWTGSDPPPAGESDRVLCIHGVTGCGKSVLVSTLAESLTSRGELAIFFSFWGGDEGQQTIDTMLRTVLWQLLSEMPEANATQSLARISPLKRRTAPVLVAEISSLLQQVARPVYMLIDGLSECMDSWNSVTDGGLMIISEWMKMHSNLRVVLSGRETSLRQALKTFPMHLQITKDLVLADLEDFVSAQLNQLPAMFSESLKADAMTTIVRSRDDATFLWADLVLRELKLSANPEDFCACLENLPSELDDEYRRLLSKLARRLDGSADSPSGGMMKARDLLALVVAAARPLTIEELRSAHAIKLCAESEWERDAISDGKGKEGNDAELLEICGDFITISNEQAHLSHSSVEDFLTRPEDRWEPDALGVKFFRVDYANAHRDLGLICIEALQATCQDNAKQTRDLAASSMAAYASDFWAVHLLKSGPPSPETLPKVVDFLKSPAIYGCIEHAVAGMMKEFKHITVWTSLLQVLTWCGEESGVQKAVLPKLQEAFAKEIEKHKHNLEDLGILDEGWVVLAKEQDSTPDTEDATSSSSPEDRHALTVDQVQALSNIVNGVVLNSTTSSGLDVQFVATMNSTVATLNSFFDSFRDTFLHAASSVLQVPVPIAILMGSMHCLQGRHEQCVTICKSALKSVDGTGNGWEAVLVALIGGCNFHVDNFEEAIPYLDRAAALADATRIPYYEALASICASGAANARIAIGKSEQAEEMIEQREARMKALHVSSRRRSRPVPFENEVLQYANLQMNDTAADIHFRKTRFDKAEKVLKESEAFLSKTRMKSMSWFCHNDSFLAMVLIVQGRDKEAEKLLRRARANAEKRYGYRGNSGSETLKRRNKLAHFLAKRGRFEEAKAELKGIDKLLVSEQAEMNDVADDCVLQMCTVHQKLGEHDKAASLRAGLVPVYDKAFGKSNLRSMNNLWSLVKHHEDAGQHAGAEDALVNIMQTLEKTTPRDNPEALRVFENLFQVQLAQGKHKDAAANFQLALDLSIAEHGPNHREVGHIYALLGQALEKQGRMAEAGEAFISAGNVYMAGAAENNVADKLWAIHNLTIGHQRAGSWSPERIEQELVPWLKKVQRYEGLHWYRSVCLISLGCALRDLKRYGEAIEKWNEALKLMKKMETDNIQQMLPGRAMAPVAERIAFVEESVAQIRGLVV